MQLKNAGLDSVDNVELVRSLVAVRVSRGRADAVLEANHTAAAHNDAPHIAVVANEPRRGHPELWVDSLWRDDLKVGSGKAGGVDTSESTIPAPATRPRNWPTPSTRCCSQNPPVVTMPHYSPVAMRDRADRMLASKMPVTARRGWLNVS